MAKFWAAHISRPGCGSCWLIQGITDEDKQHIFAKQKAFDGNLSFEALLDKAWKNFGVDPNDIEYYG
jgi:hypothetical protein